jgi:hypothetical protein
LWDQNQEALIFSNQITFVPLGNCHLKTALNVLAIKQAKTNPLFNRGNSTLLTKALQHLIPCWLEFTTRTCLPVSLLFQFPLKRLLFIKSKANASDWILYKKFWKKGFSNFNTNNLYNFYFFLNLDFFYKVNLIVNNETNQIKSRSIYLVYNNRSVTISVYTIQV